MSGLEQSGFELMLAEADADNRQRKFDSKTAHLPDTLAEVIPFHRKQIADHHAAMLDCDFECALGIREEAHLLAKKLNGGKPGILAGEDAPGCVLAKECAAKPGDIPYWGQDGAFVLQAAGTRLSVTMKGMFGICATAMTFLGFSVCAVDRSKPFISATGYRSFLGCSVVPSPGMTTDAFCRRVVEHFVAQDLKGRLVAIEDRYS